MKKASGYITADGSFFENEGEAILYEAELRLRGRLATEFPEVNHERFFTVLVNVMSELREYVNAYKDKRVDAKSEDGKEDAGGEKAKADDGLGHIDSAEKDLASLLKLPVRGSEHVPDVGSSSRSEKVSDRRSKHGPGVRGKDA